MHDKELEYIKKYYGEQMMHMCRVMFPRILETEGVLKKILTENFLPCHHLAEDIVKQGAETEFKSFVFAMSNLKSSMTPQQAKELKKKTAVQLMRENGWILYPECKTEKELQSFKKYYASDEVLCTFNDNRLKTHRVWFAVKEDVDKIKRAEPGNEKRQDNYGTSVLSIQFERDKMPNLQIICRYNHTVKNPNNAFCSNLDNIIDGLTDAFERDYGVRSALVDDVDFALDDYVDYNGKFYPCNIIKHGFNCSDYFCENNVYIEKSIYADGGLKTINPDGALLVDDYLFNFKDKKIMKYNFGYDFGFRDATTSFLPGEKCQIKSMSFSKKDNKIKIQVVGGENVIVGINDHYQLVSYCNPNIEVVPRQFLYDLPHITKVDLPNVVELESMNLTGCRELREVNLPKLERISSGCFTACDGMTELDLPKLKYAGPNNFNACRNLTKVNIPNAKSISYDGFCACPKLKEVVAPKNVKMGYSCFCESPQAKLVCPKTKSRAEKKREKEKANLDKYVKDAIRRSNQEQTK